MAGNQVAIKRFWDPTKKELENHKRIMEKNGSHENIIRLVETFCDFKEPLWWTYDEGDDQPDANDLKSKLNANEVTRDRHKKYVDSLGLDLKAIGNTPLQGRMLHLFTSMASFDDSDRPTAGIAFNHVDSMFKKISLNDVPIPPKSGVKRSQNDR
ncbi:MAG: hypothetical protein L6R37_007917 [Teloschistes peruensis]|nr:MAG: hypothetical protein L6R37_007917 [Teloschistes peruensis]